MRKKWTSRENITDTLLNFREKRKWQITLRRYLLEEKRCPAYAPYFGLDIRSFRAWIALQFDEDLTWDNFSGLWQLEHIVPIAYFDFNNPEEMKLAWNFTNIKVERIYKKGKADTETGITDTGTETVDARQTSFNRIDILGAQSYYEALFRQTAYPVCEKMLEHLAAIILRQIKGINEQVNFFSDNKDLIMDITGFSSYQLEQLNAGISREDILKEAALLNKMGLQ